MMAFILRTLDVLKIIYLDKIMKWRSGVRGGVILKQG